MNAINKESLPTWVSVNEITYFFYLFSKLEHAMKCNGFLKAHQQAEANWEELAEELGDSFFTNIKDASEVKILFEKPAEKQINNNGKISWRSCNIPKKNKELFLGIRQVRNNLFHGGKYESGEIEEPSRNEELLDACIFVMEKVIENYSKICNTFNESFT